MAATQSWEYVAEEYPVQPGENMSNLSVELTAKGQNGWELVGFHWLPATEPGMSAHIACIFKRPRNQPWHQPK